MNVSDLIPRRWTSDGPERGGRHRDSLTGLSKEIIHDFLTNNIPHMAASISFWGFFSIFPMVLAIVLMTGGILSYDSFIEELGESVPVSQEFLTDSLDGVTETWPYTGLVSIVGLVWASLAVFAATRKGINAAWGITRPRSFFRERFIDFSLMLGAWLVFVISVSITPIIEFSRNTTYVGRFITWETYWALMGAGLPLILTLGVFMFLYRFIPNTRVNWRDVWLGGIVSAVSFEVLRHGFVWYIGRFSIYNLLYGTAATLVVLLAWVYFSAVILLFGAVVSSRINKLRKLRAQSNVSHLTAANLDVGKLVLTKTEDDD